MEAGRRRLFADRRLTGDGGGCGTTESWPATAGCDGEGIKKNMRFRWIAISFIGLGMAALPLAAHHSFAAEYDDTKPIKVTGVVTKIEWQNPHIWFYVDVKDDSGKVVNWAFSGGAPGQLMRRGITRDVIQPGMTIQVDGFLAKDGSHNGSGARVTFPDGRQVFTAGAEDKLPTDKK